MSAAVDGGNVAGASAACGAGSYKVANSCYAWCAGWPLAIPAVALLAMHGCPSCPARFTTAITNHSLRCYCCSPQGNTCAGGTAAKAVCAADYANPFLGQSSGCFSCNSGTTLVSSLAGSAYCTIPQCRPSAPCTADGWHGSSCTVPALVAMRQYSMHTGCMPLSPAALPNGQRAW